jgi:hypothetical protein
VTATTTIDFLKGLAEKDVLAADLDNPVAMPPSPKFEHRSGTALADKNTQALAYVYFEDEPGRVLQSICSRAMRRGASLPTSPSCRS